MLSYIDPDRVDDLLKFVSSRFDLSFFFDYEMFNPEDRFGQMMVKNFKLKGCPLIGINKYPMLNDQIARFTNAGFQKTEAYTMAQMYITFYLVITIA